MDRELPPAQIMSRRRTTVLARFRPFAPALLILFSASCFEYGGGPVDHVPTGRDIRVTLTPEARTTLGSRIGAQVKSVNGIVRSADTSGVLIAMSRTTLVDGTEAPWNGDTITIPSKDIALIEQRKLSGSKTLVLAAIIAGLTAAVAVSIGVATSTSSSSTTSGNVK